MKSRLNIIAGSAALLFVLVLLLFPIPSERRRPTRPLLVYCAAGLKAPVEAIARDYEREYGTSVQLQYGGSGTLLNNLKVSKVGDLFVAADSSFVALGRSNRLLAETLPLARLNPVVVVPKGNPKAIANLDDLLRPGLRLALANPDAAAVGALVRQVLLRAGRWDELTRNTTVFKPTVNDVANDVKLGSVDAGIVWDATAAQYPDLAAVQLAQFDGVESEVSVSVLEACSAPAAALHFARYLAARDRGLQTIARHGFRAAEGDVWVSHPRVVLYSGSVNRIAIESTLREFEAREGVTVERIYNGCGILTAQIRAGQKPDAYFACDVSFMTTVSNDFRPALEIAETPIVIVARTNLPAPVRTLADLTRGGLRIGVANETQSALGALTARVLRNVGLQERIMANVSVQAPTGDLLLNQLRAGGLDAIVVYEANASQVTGLFEITPIDAPGALAVQPYAVGRNSGHTLLMERLRTTLISASSRSRFQEAGFRWRAPAP